MSEQQVESGKCFLAGISECSGMVKNNICESHSKEIFRIVWR